MDSLSHAVVGAILPQTMADKRQIRKLGFIGIISALLPDLDTLIGSSTDPLLNLEYHRHFTHSFLFAPLAAVIAAVGFYFFFKRKLSFLPIFLTVLASYLSGILLDLCTTYGTRVFWPFSYEKYSFNCISIVDPIFTLTLLTGVVIAFRKRSTKSARLSVAFMLCYLSFGAFQRERAADLQVELVAKRGHQLEEQVVKPTLGNIFLWRTIYLYEGRYYVDALRPAWFTGSKVYEGESAEKFIQEKHLPLANAENVVSKDIIRFTEFSQGYLILDPYQSNIIGDVRYAMLPDEVKPIWGIRIFPTEADRHAEFEQFREVDKQKMKGYLAMIFGRDREYKVASTRVQINK